MSANCTWTVTVKTKKDQYERKLLVSALTETEAREMAMDQPNVIEITKVELGCQLDEKE